jgi:hypothetical protein
MALEGQIGVPRDGAFTGGTEQQRSDRPMRHRGNVVRKVGPPDGGNG